MMRFKDDDRRFIEIEVSGKLTRDDYARVSPQLEQAVNDRGALRVLIRLKEFEGWKPAAMLDELRLDIRHRKDFERIAVAGESNWEKLATKITAPFFSGEVRFFDDAAAAASWLIQ